MQLMKRDPTSGTILTMVDTDALTDEERAAVSEELHELVVDDKSREAVDVTEQGIDAQVQYLMAKRGVDALTDIILDTLDAVDRWRSWK